MLFHTVSHPARKWLLTAGALGVLEGWFIGSQKLLSDPVWVTLVGEMNESALTLLGLRHEINAGWRQYNKLLKEFKQVLHEDV